MARGDGTKVRLKNKSAPRTKITPPSVPPLPKLKTTWGPLPTAEKILVRFIKEKSGIEYVPGVWSYTPDGKPVLNALLTPGKDLTSVVWHKKGINGKYPTIHWFVADALSTLALVRFGYDGNDKYSVLAAIENLDRWARCLKFLSRAKQRIGLTPMEKEKVVGAYLSALRLDKPQALEGSSFIPRAILTSEKAHYFFDSRKPYRLSELPLGFSVQCPGGESIPLPVPTGIDPKKAKKALQRLCFPERFTTEFVIAIEIGQKLTAAPHRDDVGLGWATLWADIHRNDFADLLGRPPPLFLTTQVAAKIAAAVSKHFEHLNCPTNDEAIRARFRRLTKDHAPDALDLLRIVAQEKTPKR
jgi:hypothetical protein